MDAYFPLETALKRAGNLTICTNALVHRIQCSTDKVGHRAERVLFQKVGRASDQVFSVDVRKEVIVSSGTIGIPVAWEVPMTASLTHLLTFLFEGAVEFLKYIFFRKAIQVLSLFVSSPSLDDETARPTARVMDENKGSSSKLRLSDLEIIPLATTAMDDFKEHQRFFSKIGVFSLQASVLRPQSCGTVRLASSDPSDPSKIDLCFLSDPMDLALARKAIRLVLDLGNACATRCDELAGAGVSVLLWGW
ncbi:MAG: hypothetical protein LQ345_003212 [Seirophora villosa]|nr:MAG: hypothetical protein LQ345_003212 [Seirophora villosa]